MKLTKAELEAVHFKGRGRRYDAKEVDAFLDRVTVAAEEGERELAELREENRELAARAEALEKENSQLRELAESSSRDVEEISRRVVAKHQELFQALESREDQEIEKLREERERLIQDVRALKLFRENFRKAVEQDAAALTEQARSLESDKMLKTGESNHD